MVAIKPHLYRVFLKILKILTTWPSFLEAVRLPTTVMKNSMPYLMRLIFTLNFDAGSYQNEGSKIARRICCKHMLTI